MSHCPIHNPNPDCPVHGEPETVATFTDSPFDWLVDVSGDAVDTDTEGYVRRV